MGKRTFLEKKMKDKRFRDNEELIMNVFLAEHQKGISVQKLAQKAGVGRGTMYIHHHALKEVIPDYDRYILLEYNNAIGKKLRRKNIELRILYIDFLVFIARNRKIFKMFLKFDHREIFAKMLGKMKTKIIAKMRLPKNAHKIFRIYTGEVIELIAEWGEKGFPEAEIDKVLTDMVYLTETSRDRLMPLVR